MKNDEEKHRLSPFTNSGVMLSLLLLSFYVGLPNKTAAADEQESTITDIFMNVPTLYLNQSSSQVSVSIEPGFFSLTTTGEIEPAFPVRLDVRYRESIQVLEIEFEFLNNEFVEQNNYAENNSAMWHQEVFEMFIAAGTDSPSDYVEIQLNPNGALFSAWVSNPNGKGTENTVKFFAGRERGIETLVTKDKAAWSGKVLFPVAILGNVEDHYRINFFRIVAFQPHDPDRQWECTSTTCAFLAWSPTFSGSSPAFHVPAYFGHLILQ